MHPRNMYNDAPDFYQLSEAYPPLRQYIKQLPTGSWSIDFKNEAAQRCLTTAFLHRDFNITLTLPSDRLCPPIPNRLNYVLWIQDLVRATQLALGEGEPSHPKVTRGIDIGVGASAIYPLLACSLESSWAFVGTDIDELSLKFARENISSNNLTSRVSVVQSSTDGPLIAHLLSRDTASIPRKEPEFDFTMCNPPFYSSEEDVLRSAEAKEFAPNAVCTGSVNEMITKGGEAHFVGRLVEESLILRTRCRWYTSMVGKLSSVVEVVKFLQRESITNYAITEFLQGQTRRWAIGWTFDNARLPDNVARINNAGLQGLMPIRNTLHQKYELPPPSQVMLRKLDIILRGVLEDIPLVKVSEVSLHDIPINAALDLGQTLLVHVSENTWSRAARRKAKQGAPLSAAPLIPHNATSMAIMSTRWIAQTLQTQSVVLEMQWVWGRDRSLFEGLSGHVSRKVGATLAHETG